MLNNSLDTFLVFTHVSKYHHSCESVGNAEFAGVVNAGVLKQVRQDEMWYRLTVVGLFVGNLDSTVTLTCAHPQHSGKKSVYSVYSNLTFSRRQTRWIRHLY